jgi:hypothetical protein
MRSRFVASRQITVYDPTLVALIKSALKDNAEFPVNCSGYMTSTVRGEGDNAIWYDNQVVTELELI